MAIQIGNKVILIIKAFLDLEEDIDLLLLKGISIRGCCNSAIFFNGKVFIIVSLIIVNDAPVLHQT